MKKTEVLKSWKDVKVGDVIQNIINNSTYRIQSITEDVSGLHISMIHLEDMTYAGNVAPAKHYTKIGHIFN